MNTTGMYLEALIALRIVHCRLVGQKDVSSAFITLQELANRNQGLLGQCHAGLIAEHNRFGHRVGEPLLDLFQ